MVLLYVALVFVRPIDGDEGLYLTASDEVARGHQLYRDVAYFQFPLLPYLYAGWMKLVSGPSPAGVRALSVAWDAGTLAAIYLWCRSRKLDDELTTIVLVLFGASGMTVAWASTIKTYPLCNFLSVTSFVASVA